MLALTADGFCSSGWAIPPARQYKKFKSSIDWYRAYWIEVLRRRTPDGDEGAGAPYCAVDETDKRRCQHEIDASSH